MEIDVTSIIKEHLDESPPACLCSGSVHELGHNAANITWRNSVELAKRLDPVNDENREDIVDHFMEYGAWTEDEVRADVSGLFVQEIMAAVRQLEEAGIDLSEPVSEEQFCEATENEGGNLYPGDEGNWFFYAGI